MMFARGARGGGQLIKSIVITSKNSRCSTGCLFRFQSFSFLPKCLFFDLVNLQHNFNHKFFNSNCGEKVMPGVHVEPTSLGCCQVSGRGEEGVKG